MSMKHENEIGKLQQKEATEKEDGNKSAREIWREKKKTIKTQQKKSKEEMVEGKGDDCANEKLYQLRR